jgi:FkbM family methyltransferase
VSFDRAKALARAYGVYRATRWIRRHTFKRQELRDLKAERAFYSQFVQPGSLCFDVGANYGAKTEVFLGLGAHVVAFEPQEDCLKELHARLTPHPHLVTVRAAVGETCGVGILFVESHRTASSLVPGWQGEVVGSVQVPMTTLDEAIEKFGVPQHCKIDVEGYELEVLKGLSRPIPSLSYEYHLRNRGASRALACLQHLSQFGELRVNVAPAETARLARPQWWQKNEFIDFFMEEIPRMHAYEYGDIFVQVLEPGVSSC